MVGHDYKWIGSRWTWSSKWMFIAEMVEPSVALNGFAQEQKPLSFIGSFSGQSHVGETGLVTVKLELDSISLVSRWTRSGMVVHCLGVDKPLMAYPRNGSLRRNVTIGDIFLQLKVLKSPHRRESLPLVTISLMLKNFCGIKCMVSWEESSPLVTIFSLFDELAQSNSSLGWVYL